MVDGPTGVVVVGGWVVTIFVAVSIVPGTVLGFLEGYPAGPGGVDGVRFTIMGVSPAAGEDRVS